MAVGGAAGQSTRGFLGVLRLDEEAPGAGAFRIQAVPTYEYTVRHTTAPRAWRAPALLTPGSTGLTCVPRRVARCTVLTQNPDGTFSWFRFVGAAGVLPVCVGPFHMALVAGAAPSHPKAKAKKAGDGLMQGGPTGLIIGGWGNLANWSAALLAALLRDRR